MRVWIAIWVGSSRLSRVVVGWLTRQLALKLGCLVLAAGFLKGLPWTTRITTALALTWLAVAITLGLRAPTPAPPEAEDDQEHDEEEDEEEDEPDEHPARALSPEELADLLRGLLGERGGVHLTTLAQALPGPRLPTRDVRALLAAVGIRVRPGVRGPDGAGREGVHRDDIPPPSSPTGSPAQRDGVSAGQRNNNNGNNEPDDEFVVEADPENPARSLVRWARRRPTH